METKDFEYISNLVKKDSGIILSIDKVYLIESRLAALLRKENLASIIYFEPDVKNRILENVGGILKSDGFLFLGQSERVSTSEPLFKPCGIKSVPCFWLKEGEKMAGVT